MTLHRNKASVARASTKPSMIARRSWSAPRLERKGTVAALTTRVDNKGNDDGGTGFARRS